MGLSLLALFVSLSLVVAFGDFLVAGIVVKSSITIVVIPI